jgi:hypothetical protein
MRSAIKFFYLSGESQNSIFNARQKKGKKKKEDIKKEYSEEFILYHLIIFLSLCIYMGIKFKYLIQL